jgi:hypothetical protein
MLQQQPHNNSRLKQRNTLSYKPLATQATQIPRQACVPIENVKEVVFVALSSFDNSFASTINLSGTNSSGLG